MKLIRFFIRFGMIVTFLAILYGFLNIPKVYSFFRESRSINVLAWPNIIDSRYFDQFEKDTGIKVYITYFENYEELLVKLKVGIQNYDLIMGTDYIIKDFIKEGIVKKIDKEKFMFWDHIYPSLLNHYYDPENDYTIPYSWEVLGLGIDTDYYDGKMPSATWKLLFDKAYAPERVGIIDDARELTSIALFYLFGNNVIPDDKQLDAVLDLLLEQKKWVAAYTDLRTDFLLISRSAPVVLGISSDIYHAKKTHPHIDFLVPEEGSFAMVDSFLIPVSTRKDELVYAFLNYLYQPDIIAKYAARFYWFPVTDHIGDENSHIIMPTPSLFSQSRFINYQIPDQQLRKLWVTLKS